MLAKLLPEGEEARAIPGRILGADLGAGEADQGVVVEVEHHGQSVLQAALDGPVGPSA